MKKLLKKLAPAGVALLLASLLASCSSDDIYGQHDLDKEASLLTVEAKSSYGGGIQPSQVKVEPGRILQFNVASTVDGYAVSSVTGCGGTLDGQIYTTGQITAACTVVAEFNYMLPQSHVIRSKTIYDHGTVTPALVSVRDGSAAQFKIDHIAGYDPIFSGCAGEYNAPYFTTAPLTSACELDVSFKVNLPNTHVLSVIHNDGGTVTPTSLSVEHGKQAQFIVEPYAGFAARFVGCEGEYRNSLYITSPNHGPCTLRVEFYSEVLDGVLLTSKSDTEGVVHPALMYVPKGASGQFVITPVPGKKAGRVTGCPGKLEGNVFTTDPIFEPCEILVSYQQDFPDSFLVEVTAGSGGAVSPSRIGVQKGTIGQFFVTPNAGKAIGSVNAIGCNVEVSGNTIMTTAALAADCAINVLFTDSVTLSTSIAGGGKITPAVANVAPGTTVSFNVIPNNGYELGTAYGCGGAFNSNRTIYTVTAGATSCEVHAVFNEATMYNVTALSFGQGTITPPSTRVANGTVVNFRFTPANGWELERIAGCDGQISNNNYAVPVTKDCEIIAFFEPKLPPTNVVAATSTSSAGLDVRFSPVAGAISYNIYYARTPAVTPYNYEGLWRGLGGTAGTIWGMIPETTYYVIVTANFGRGNNTYEGQPSAAVIGTTSVRTHF